tara:strand:- start:966 stop:1169 length:204 start_codon:yes stop_codon:yes gene_type:complete
MPQIKKALIFRSGLFKYGGEGGIRTLDGVLAHTPLAGERLQPLGHLSGMFQHNAGGFAAKALFSKAC